MIGRRVSISRRHQRLCWRAAPTATSRPARRRRTAAQPSVLGEVQPQTWPWVIASRIAESPAARPAAPSQSMVPVVLRGRDGTTSTTMAMTRSVKAVVSQNTRW